MIPLLYANTATDFTTLGIGEVSEAIEGYVEEERNGAFTLSMTVPETARYADSLNIGTIVVADASPGQPRQAFEIAKVTKKLNGRIEVYAEHISYRLLYSVLRPFSVAGLNNVFGRFNSKTGTNYVDGNSFTFAWSGWPSASATVTLNEFVSVKQCLQGMTGSVLDTYGGCYKWNNFTVTLYYSRGSDKGVRIVYGKNLTDAQAEYNNQNIATANGVFPVYKNGDTVIGGTTIATTGNRSLYAYHRTLVHDFTSDISVGDGESTSSIQSKLNSAATSYVSKYLRGVPDVNLKTSFIPLHQTIEYADLANVENVEIDDTVYVYVPTLDIDVATKVIKTRYNFLQDRYDTVEVGNFRTTINQAIRAVKGA